MRETASALILLISHWKEHIGRVAATVVKFNPRLYRLLTYGLQKLQRKLH